MRTVRIQICLTMLVMLLTSCGGGGGGSTSSSEIPVVLGQLGPGDTNNYFPFSIGNVWHYAGTTTSNGVATQNYQNTAAITGTTLINGSTALIYNEVASNNPYRVYIDYLVMDPNGIASLGQFSTDSVAPNLSDFWEYPFPIEVGRKSVLFDRRSMDLGRDLDSDLINETFDLRIELTVANIGTLTVPVGTYVNVAELDISMTLTFYLSSNQNAVSSLSTVKEWYAPDLGLIRSESSSTFQGVTETDIEELDAYSVDGQRQGIVTLADQVSEFQGISNHTYIYSVPATTGQRKNVALQGLSDDANLMPLMPGTCVVGHTGRLSAEPEDCALDSVGNQFLFAVDAINSTDYTISISDPPDVPLPVSEGTLQNPLSIAHDQPTVGQVETRGTSYYMTTGLTSGSHTVSISGLSADATLHVYPDATYSLEYGCTLVMVPDILNTPEDCTAPNTDSLYFSVSAGPLNRDGASYVLLAH